MISQATHSLKVQIDALEAIPHPVRAAAFVQAVKDAFDHYLEPGNDTHLFEATLMGVHVRADNLDELTVNWLRAAKNCAKSIEPRHNEALADRQILGDLARAKAMAIIASPNAPTDALRAACAVIIESSSDHLEQVCARQILAMTERQASNA